MGEDELLELLNGCPHGDGCEANCPMEAIRRQCKTKQQAQEAIKQLNPHGQREIEQVHRLCIRERRK